MPSGGCRPRAMRFITTKQAALGSILLEDGSDILLGRSANPLANIHTEVPSAASSLPHPSPSPSQSVAFPSRPKLLILVSPMLCSTANSIWRLGHHGSVDYIEFVSASVQFIFNEKKKQQLSYCFVIKSFKMSVIIEFESENSSRYIDAALNK